METAILSPQQSPAHTVHAHVQVDPYTCTCTCITVVSKYSRHLKKVDVLVAYRFRSTVVLQPYNLRSTPVLFAYHAYQITRVLCEISCNLCTHEFTRALIVVCVIGSVKVLLRFLHRVELMSVYIVTWLRVGNCLPTMSYPSTFTAVLL